MLSRKCTKCEQVLPVEMFRKDARGLYGREARCKDCKDKYGKKYREKNKDKLNSQYRSKYAEHPRIRYPGRYQQQDKQRRRTWYAQHPNAKKAHLAVYGAVRSKKIPKISSLTCSRCSKRAAHYHHYLGYDPAHWFDIIPLCQSCHLAVEAALKNK